MTDMITDMAERLFTSHNAGMETLWPAVEDAGLPLALLAEEEGGFGFSSAEALGILRISARHAISSPLAETMLANRVLAWAGLEPISGPSALVTGPPLSGDAVKGLLRRVPWGRAAKSVVMIADGRVLRLDSGWECVESYNIAGEPRDDLQLDAAPETHATCPFEAEIVPALGAALRAVEIAGAVEAALALTVGYANDRVQFGRSIGKFQAVQQNLAVMAGQVAAARAAADLVAEAFDLVLSDPRTFRLHAAVAKLRAGEAAGICAAIAHQVHGAIGFTEEYALHPLTRRLWSWRDEYGNETHWAEQISSVVMNQEAGKLWPLLTGEPVVTGASQ